MASYMLAKDIFLVEGIQTNFGNTTLLQKFGLKKQITLGLDYTHAQVLPSALRVTLA